MTRATNAFGASSGGDGQGRAAANNRTFTPRRPDTPRKVRGGIKLQGTLHREMAPDSSTVAREADYPGTASAHRLLDMVQSKIVPAVWAEGLAYAQAGQVVSIEFQSGAIAAQVQGTSARPYLTQIRCPVFTDEQWQRVVELMAGEAVHVAKLLAGAWPSSIEQRLESQGLPLLPVDSSDLAMTCTCQQNSSVGSPTCSHLATTALIAAEMLASHPQHLFTWRGRSPELLMEHLRGARLVHAGDGRSAEARPWLVIAEASPAVPLEACLDDFWRSPVTHAAADSQSSTPEVPHVPHVPHALLRRLGPSPMNGRFPMVGLLASVYDEVSAAARRLRDGDLPEGVSSSESTPPDAAPDQ